MSPISGVGGPSASQAGIDQIQKNAADGSFELPSDGAGDAAYYLQLMQEMQAEARAYTTFSNILSMRNQSAMNAIRNIRQ